MKTKWKISGTLLIILVGGLMLLSTQEFDLPTNENLDLRVNYLERVLVETTSPASEMALIAKENYEFPLFSYAFTSYAMTNLAFLNEEYIARAENVILFSRLMMY